MPGMINVLQPAPCSTEAYPRSMRVISAAAGWATARGENTLPIVLPSVAAPSAQELERRNFRREKYCFMLMLLLLLLLVIDRARYKRCCFCHGIEWEDAPRVVERWAHVGPERRYVKFDIGAEGAQGISNFLVRRLPHLQERDLVA